MGESLKGQRALHKEIMQTHLCTGCGACINLCPYQAIHEDRIILLHDCDLSEGRCYAYCPRTPTDLAALRKKIFDLQDWTPGLGVVKGFYVVRAAEPSQRTGVQHGGTVSALMTIAMQEKIIDSVVASDEGVGLLPRGITVNFPEEIRKKARSRFVVSPNLAEFNALSWAGGRMIGVVATPCQALALAKMRTKPVQAHATRIEQLKFVVGLFCGWTLSWERIRALLQRKGIDEEMIVGMDVPPSKYQVLQVYTKEGTIDIPLTEVDPDCVRDSCRSCGDMTAEYADISVGSARLPEGWEAAKGWNHVIVRTALGEQVLALAHEKGILEFRDAPAENLERLKKASARKRENASKNLKEATGDEVANMEKRQSFGLHPLTLSVSEDNDTLKKIIPMLKKAICHQSDLILVVREMSGDARVDIAEFCRAMGARVEVQDPFELEATRKAISRMRKENDVRILLLRQSFVFNPAQGTKKEYNITISETLCLGEQCGCNRICTRVFHCPGLVWSPDKKKPQIDETVCTGCGACSLICTTGALIRKRVEVGINR